MPTYKLSFTENVYVEKKDQSPSYTDRIMFRNNTNTKVVSNYHCLSNILGSDHRTVVLDLVFQNFNSSRSHDVYQSNKKGVIQIDLAILEMKWADLKQMLGLTNSSLRLRLQFIANYLSIDSEVLNSSEENEENTMWSKDNIPDLITPLNSIDLIKTERLTMLVWARDKKASETSFTLVG